MRDESCHRCQANDGGPRIFDITGEIGGTYLRMIFDVDSAFQFAERNVEPTVPPMDVVRDLIFTNLSETFCGQHTFHVDVTVPPLIAQVREKFMLLDGTHRMVRMLGKHMQPRCYVLNEEQSTRFIVGFCFGEKQIEDIPAVVVIAKTLGVRMELVR